MELTFHTQTASKEASRWCLSEKFLWGEQHRKGDGEALWGEQHRKGDGEVLGVPTCTACGWEGSLWGWHRQKPPWGGKAVLHETGESFLQSGRSSRWNRGGQHLPWGQHLLWGQHLPWEQDHVGCWESRAWQPRENSGFILRMMGNIIGFWAGVTGSDPYFERVSASQLDGGFGEAQGRRWETDVPSVPMHLWVGPSSGFRQCMQMEPACGWQPAYFHRNHAFSVLAQDWADLTWTFQLLVKMVPCLLPGLPTWPSASPTQQLGLPPPSVVQCAPVCPVGTGLSMLLPKLHAGN